MKVYVLLVNEFIDDNIEPVLYGTFSTREKAEFRGMEICNENEYCTSFDVTETILDE